MTTSQIPQPSVDANQWLLGGIERDHQTLGAAIATLVRELGAPMLAKALNIGDVRLVDWCEHAEYVPYGYRLVIGGVLLAHGKREGDADLEAIGRRCAEEATRNIRVFLLGMQAALVERPEDERRAIVERIARELLFCPQLPPEWLADSSHISTK